MDSLAEGAPAPGVSSASSILRAWSNDRGIKIFDFQQVEALGREYPRRHIPPQPEEGTLPTVVKRRYYTSISLLRPVG